MNNKRLDKLSSSYIDREGALVESRAFFLFGGQDFDTGSAFSMDIGIHVFDDPLKPKNIHCDITIDNFLVEMNTDVVYSLIQIIPDYKTVLRFGDLSPKAAKKRL